jgi:hypothetical protein
MAPLPLMQNLIEVFLSWLCFARGFEAPKFRPARANAPANLCAANYHGCRAP